MEKTNNNNRPKLELLLNKPVTVKLLKDKPFEGSSSYGSYVLYSVEHEGTEKAFFATPEVHQELAKNGLKVGDEFILTKVAHQNGRRISPKIEVEVIKKIVEAELPKTTEPPKPTLADGLKAIMEKSLKEAVDITRSVQVGVPFQNEDIQKIASCLFIARTRTNGYN
jgi:hypothetical protein